MNATNRVVKARTIADQIADHLKAQIVSGERASGQRLTQDALAKEFNVSITPVREAVNTLASQGFVELDHANRAMVKSLTAQDLFRLYDVRKLLETYAARLACTNLSESLITELDDLCQRMLVETRPDHWYDMNDTFHRKLYSASRNEYLCHSIEYLRGLSEPYLRRYMNNTNLTTPALEHVEILKLSQEQNPSAVEAAVRSHLETTQSKLMEAITQ